MSGVGLKFTGYPNDVEQFKWILARQGCHPDAADRILKRIEGSGFDCLTVQNTLAFNWIKESLAEVGVIMTYIKPIENWYQKHPNGPWPEELLERVFSSPKQKAITLDGNLVYKNEEKI